MDFFKKHYEKLILALFLLVFVFLLLYLIDLSKSTNTITREDLKIPTREPNYRKTDFSLKKYQLSYIFSKDCIWKKSTARSDKDKIYTDLLIPFKAARCPCCEKVIPWYYFWGPLGRPRHCPLCDSPLLRPITSPVRSSIVDSLDRDNDGIPNTIEIKLGLNPDNPDDALYDMDNDGFPNIFEYQQKTNIKKSKSHPPMYMRLHLIEFRETLLPFKLKTVVTNGKKDPKEWDIQINETRRGEIKTRFKYLDSSLLLDKTSYKIIKIEAIHKEERNGGTIIKKDESKIFLKSFDNKYTITMQVDRPVYSPRPKAVIVDLATGKKYHVGAGDTIVMVIKISKSRGGRKRRRHSKTVKYKVFKVDRKKRQVIIEDRKLNKYVITAKALMPKIKQKGQTGRGVPGGDSGAMEMPSGFMDAPPGGVSNSRRTSRLRRRQGRNY